MIGFVIKNWRLFLDIILVVAIILAFTFWDPFNIFMNSKTRQTASLVTGVREIGQLVTAEYYGEVLSSWREYKLRPYPEDTVMEMAEDLYLSLINQNEPNTDNRYRPLATLKSIPAYHEMYHKFMAFLGTKYLTRGMGRIYDERNNRVKSGAEAKILRKIRQEKEDYRRQLIKRYKKAGTDEFNAAFGLYLDSIPPYLQEFYSFNTMLTKKNMNAGSNKKQNIVFIGRGWVKAGFDFGSFDENNFMYDKDSKTVHFYGLSPAILDTDINPWFIPQRKVKGFELVDFTGEVTFENAKLVKADCKAKLLEQANSAEILKRAQENGAEALKNFFALLLDEPQLKVKFHAHRYQPYLTIIKADSLVTLREARMIDSLYNNEKKRIESLGSFAERQRSHLQLTHFIEALKTLPFLSGRYHFTYYSLGAARMLRDSFHISTADTAILVSMRARLMADSTDNKTITTTVVNENPHWFTSGDFMEEFNATAELLWNEAMWIEPLQVLDSAQLKDSADRICVWDTLRDQNGKVVFFYNSDLKKHKYLPLDYCYNTQLKSALQKARNTAEMEAIYNRKRGFVVPRPAIYNTDLHLINKEEREIIYQAVRNKFTYDVSISPLKKFTKKIDDIKKSIESD